MTPRELLDPLRIGFNDLITNIKLDPDHSNIILTRTIDHINNVVENSRILASSLELNSNEIAMAEIAALFHDIGRLTDLLPDSYAKYSNHADASIEYLKLNADFLQLDIKTQEIIIQIIRNHNKPELPKKENENVLFYIKLLRDADKLEVWRETSNFLIRKSGKPNMSIDLALSDKAVVTPAFCKIIIDGGIPDKKDLVTINDLVIFQMAWVFDLNFKKSFQIVNQKQYIRHLYESLPKNDNVIEIYRMIRIYIENRI